MLCYSCAEPANGRSGHAAIAEACQEGRDLGGPRRGRRGDPRAHDTDMQGWHPQLGGQVCVHVCRPARCHCLHELSGVRELLHLICVSGARNRPRLHTPPARPPGTRRAVARQQCSAEWGSSGPGSSDIKRIHREMPVR